MSVDDATVQQLIAQALAAAGPATECCDQTERAFRDLQKRRQRPGNSLDLNLAAAEHYLFARWMVCSGAVSAMQMRAIVVGYDLKKALDRLRGKANAEQVTANPVSRPDAGVVRWGLAGVGAGGADHDRCNKTVSPPIWRPIEEVLGKPVKVY